MTDDLSLPPGRSGFKSKAQSERDEAAIRRWCAAIVEIKRGLDFEIGTREWCYLLEPHGLKKEDFDKAEKRIGQYRKLGFLPLNIVIEDTRGHLPGWRRSTGQRRKRKPRIASIM